MNILVGVISPAPIWILPRHFVGRLRTDFPRHTFLEAWDRDTLRELLPDADVAFTPFVDRDIFPSATRLRWVQNELEGPGSRIRSISDLRMGIVGLGSIGLELAKLAIPMGFHVSAIRRR